MNGRKIQHLAASLIILSDYLRNQNRLEDFEIAPICEVLELVANQIGKEVNQND